METYLEEEHVYDIFQEMMTAVVKEMPKDPIQYLIDKMENPDRKYSKFQAKTIKLQVTLLVYWWIIQNLAFLLEN